MSDAIFMLRLEHENIADVLDLLEDQLQRLEMGAPLDDSLILMALEYLEGFPDECHHPKEDLVFHLLQQRAPERVASFSDLGAAHEQLKESTKVFAKNLRSMLDEPDPAENVSLRQYVSAYRQHMAAEDQRFLPAALESLTRNDLAQLDFQLFDRKDHLFDHAAEARFAQLRGAIKKRSDSGLLASGRTTPAPTRDEIALLRSMKSIDRFNESMQDLGFRLEAYRAGGYGLERDGHWLLDIPDCPESRAAWCGYYFAKGCR